MSEFYFKKPDLFMIIEVPYCRVFLWGKCIYQGSQIKKFLNFSIIFSNLSTFLLYLAYMVILTSLLYALNRKTWKDVKKKP